MDRDYHRWYSHRLNRDMGVAVYGHYGMPILAFPTSGGDEREQEGQGMIRTLSPSVSPEGGLLARTSRKMMFARKRS